MSAARVLALHGPYDAGLHRAADGRGEAGEQTVGEQYGVGLQLALQPFGEAAVFAGVRTVGAGEQVGRELRRRGRGGRKTQQGRVVEHGVERVGRVPEERRLLAQARAVGAEEKRGVGLRRAARAQGQVEGRDAHRVAEPPQRTRQRVVARGRARVGRAVAGGEDQEPHAPPFHSTR